MQTIELSGLLVGPLADRVRAWLDAGKLDEDDLERALSEDARALVDHSVAVDHWASWVDVEGLVGLVAERLGGETGLVEWADEIVGDWLARAPIEGLMSSARRLVDGPGFLVCQASERVVRASDWRYEGGRDRFAVRFSGMGTASPALRALLGGVYARLAAGVGAVGFDVRFEGVDAEELVIFGELEPEDASLANGRLHRAALIP